MKIEPEQLATLRWLELDISLRNVRVHRGRRARAVEIAEAICKGTLDFAFAELPGSWWFRMRETGWNWRLREGQLLSFTLCAAGFATEQMELIGQLLPAALASGKPWKYTGKSPPANFEVESVSPVRVMDLAALRRSGPAIPDRGEIALRFATVLPTLKVPGRARNYLSCQGFFDGLRERIRRLFSSDIPPIPLPTDLTLHSQYMTYKELKHSSRSQDGEPQLLAGLTGPLLLKGDLRTVRDLLLLGTALNAGTRISNARGQYRVEPEPAVILDRQFPDTGLLVDVLHDLLENNDDLVEEYTVGKGFAQGDQAWADQLAAMLRASTWQPGVRREVRIGPKGNTRPIALLPLTDRVVETALHRTLRRPLDAVLEPESMGFRKGRSREQALRMLRKSIREGYNWVLESDIEAFFPSINHGVMRDLLALYLPGGDQHIQVLLERILVAPVERNGKVIIPRKGLLQGSPLSPLLANLYLDAFDEAVKQTGARLVRYADDFVIQCRSREEAEKLLVGVSGTLDKVGLRLKKSKTAIVHLVGEQALQFLGERVQSVEAINKGEEDGGGLQPRKPLYVTKGWQFLALRDNRLEIRERGTVKISVPLHRLSSVNILGPASMSTALIARCVRQGVPVSMALSSGYHMATLRPDSRKHYDIIHAHGQLHQSLAEREITIIAGQFAAAKMHNYAAFFRSRRDSSLRELALGIDRMADKVTGLARVEEVRGLEGQAATKGFEGLRLMLQEPEFIFRRRLRRPPDRVNSLLNFGYYLLFSRLNGALRSAGLNPYLGFLHSSENRYESLVCDVQELFRPYIDRLVVKLVNQKIILPGDFVEGRRGQRLNYHASGRFVEHFERAMLQPAGATTGGRRLPLGRCMDTQVELLLGWVLGRNDLSFFAWE